jgi:hypothetical protein
VGLSPLGITAGMTSEWAVTGRNLGGVEHLLISGEGVMIIDRKPKPGHVFVLAVRAERGGLPEGVRVPGHAEIPKGEMVRLVRGATAPPSVREVAARVVGIARMPRGPVSVDWAIRPMVRKTLADE